MPAKRGQALGEWFLRLAKGAVAVRLTHSGLEREVVVRQWPWPQDGDCSALAADVRAEADDWATQQETRSSFAVEVLGDSKVDDGEYTVIGSKRIRGEPEATSLETELEEGMPKVDVEDATAQGLVRMLMRHVETNQRFAVLAHERERKAYENVIRIQEEALVAQRTELREAYGLLKRQARKSVGDSDEDIEGDSNLEKFFERVMQALPAVAGVASAVNDARQANGAGAPQ